MSTTLDSPRWIPAEGADFAVLAGGSLSLKHRAGSPLTAAHCFPASGPSGDRLRVHAKLAIYGGPIRDCAILFGLSDRDPGELMVVTPTELNVEGSNSFLFCKPAGSTRWNCHTSGSAGNAVMNAGMVRKGAAPKGTLHAGVGQAMQIEATGLEDRGPKFGHVDFQVDGRSIANRAIGRDAGQLSATLFPVVALVSIAGEHCLNVEEFRLTA